MVPAIGGAPKRLTANPADDLTPVYSHDGRWIYFCSMRSGRWELWKMPAEGGEATQITTLRRQLSAHGISGRQDALLLS